MKNKKTYTIIQGDSRQVLKSFKDGHFSLICCSPPYADARKNHYDSIKPEDYPEFMLSFHDELWRVLDENGSFILNLKDKIVNGQRDRYVWKTIMALSDKGWLCQDDYIWVKNGMPGYWPNRLRDGWEYCFHLTKCSKVVMYQDAVKQPIGKWAHKRMPNLKGTDLERHNSRTNSGFSRDLRKWLGKDTVLPSNVLKLGNVGRNMGHPAVYPVGLPGFFIKLFTKENDFVLDPFGGSGSTGVAALGLGRNVVLIDTKTEYIKLMAERMEKAAFELSELEKENEENESTLEA